MKKILLILLICLPSIVHAQDLIVTSDSDTINCKITKEKSDYIYFTFKHKNEVRHSLLPIEQIKYMQKSYFDVAEVSASEMKNGDDYERLRLSVYGGFSYRVAKLADGIPDDFKDYQKELKSGYHYGADMTYFISESIGLGLKYDCFKSKNSIDEIYIDFNDGSERQYGKLSDDISIQFIGPTFFSRFFNADKSNVFLMGMGIGYLGYKNNAVIINPYEMKGSTAGLVFDFAYDMGITETTAVTLKLSVLSGKLLKYTVDDGVNKETIKLERDEAEGLGRIDLSVGLTFGW